MFNNCFMYAASAVGLDSQPDVNELTAVAHIIVLSRLTFHHSRNPPSSCLNWKQLISVSNVRLFLFNDLRKSLAIKKLNIGLCINVIIIPVGTSITKQCQTQLLTNKISIQLR